MDFTSLVITIAPYFSEGALIFILIVLVFRRPIERFLSNFIPQHFQHLADVADDSREFEQAVESRKLEAKLKRDDQYIALLADYHSWGRDLIHNELIEMRTDFNERLERLEQRHEALEVRE